MKKGSSYFYENYFYARARLSAFVVLAILMGPLFANAKSPKSSVPAASSNASFNADLQNPDPNRRLLALEQGRGKISSQTLKDRFNQETDPRVRYRLSHSLAASDVPGADDLLIKSLQTEPDPLVRKGAAEALAKYARNPAVTKALADRLSKEDRIEIRYAIATDLSLSDTPESVAALEIASKDPDASLRRHVAYCLKRHSGKKAKEILRRLKSDVDSSVRHQAGSVNP